MTVHLQDISSFEDDNSLRTRVITILLGLSDKVIHALYGQCIFIVAVCSDREIRHVMRKIAQMDSIAQIARIIATLIFTVNDNVGGIFRCIVKGLLAGIIVSILLTVIEGNRRSSRRLDIGRKIALIAVL